MTEFDYVCLFMAIPIGLALAELAQGMSLALRRIGDLSIGWLTPLTVLFMLLIVSMMIENFWAMREEVVVSMPLIFVGFLFTMVFYVAASFVFPERLDSNVPLDEWFMRNRKFSLGGTTLLGLGFFNFYLLSRSDGFSDEPILFSIFLLIIMLIFSSPIIYAIRAQTVRRALIGLVTANLLYLLLILSFVMRN